MNEIKLKAASEGLEVAKEFLQKLINPSVEELGLLVADNIKFWRFKNQLRIIQKAEKHISENNIKIKQIPIKVLVPLLEGASLEEDTELKDMWVALLVNYADSGVNISTSVFPDILKQLSSKDVVFLDYLLTKIRIDAYKMFNFANEKNIGIENFYNLQRLGLIELLRSQFTEKDEYSMTIPVYDDGVGEVVLTPLGELFIKTCTLGKKEG